MDEVKRRVTSPKRFAAIIGILLSDLISGILATAPLSILFLIIQQVWWNWFGPAEPDTVDDPLSMALLTLLYLPIILIPAIVGNLALMGTAAIKGRRLALIALFIMFLPFILILAFPNLTNIVLFWFPD